MPCRSTRQGRVAVETPLVIVETYRLAMGAVATSNILRTGHIADLMPFRQIWGPTMVEGDAGLWIAQSALPPRLLGRYALMAAHRCRREGKGPARTSSSADRCINLASILPHGTPCDRLKALSGWICVCAPVSASKGGTKAAPAKMPQVSRKSRVKWSV